MEYVLGAIIFLGLIVFLIYLSGDINKQVQEINRGLPSKAQIRPWKELSKIHKYLTHLEKIRTHSINGASITMKELITISILFSVAWLLVASIKADWKKDRKTEFNTRK